MTRNTITIAIVLSFFCCTYGTLSHSAVYDVGPGKPFPTLDNLFNSVILSQDDIINIYADDSSLIGDIITMEDMITFQSGDGSIKTITQANGTSTDRGGIFRFDGRSNMTLNNLRFEGSEVTGSNGQDGGQGAAIYSYQSSTIIANNVQFVNNTAYGGTTTVDGGQGAAIISKLDLVMDNSSNLLFSGNRVFAADDSQSSGLGGAIFTLDDMSLKNMSNVSFINNQAHGANASSTLAKQTGLGGAIGNLDLWSDHKFFLTGTNILFDGNLATSGTQTGSGNLLFSGLGGAIFTDQEAVISGTTFTNNRATTSNTGEMTNGLGGAIYFAGPSLTLNAQNGNNILFKGNTHNPGNTGQTPNSIYFGNIDEGSAINNVNFVLNVDGNSVIEMYDPLSSQADDLTTGAGSSAGSINLTIDKMGAGTWILGGHNLMQSSTVWNVNQGRLMLDIVNNAPVHIDMRSQNTSSFNLANGASILVNPGTAAHMISAKDINFAQGSKTGLWQGGAFTYDRLPVAEEVAMFSLRATDSLNNESEIMNPSGTFSSGMYDYDYGLYWRENDGLSQDLVAYLHTETYSTERSGGSALTSAGATSRVTHGAVNQMYQKRLAWNFRCLDDCPETIYPATCPEGVDNDCDRQYKLWVTPSYNYVDSSTDSNYRISNPGIGVGIDGCFDNNFFLGIGFFAFWPGYRSSYADVDGQSINLMLYGGTRLPAGLELGLNAGLGYSWFDQERSVHGHRYSSEYDASNWNLGANLGRRFDLNESWELRPFVDYQFIRIDVDGYTEDQSGVYALDVDKHHENLHTVRVGTDLTYTIDNTHFIRGRVYYAGQHGDTRPQTNVRFVMDQNRTDYISYGDRLDRDSLGLGLDGLFRLSENVELAAKYELEVSKNVTSHFGGLSLVYNF